MKQRIVDFYGLKSMSDIRSVWGNSKKGGLTHTSVHFIPFLLSDAEFKRLPPAFWEEGGKPGRRVAFVPRKDRLVMSHFVYAYMDPAPDDTRPVKAVRLERDKNVAWIVWKPSRPDSLYGLVDATTGAHRFTKEDMDAYIGPSANDDDRNTYAYEQTHFKQAQKRYPMVSASKAANGAIRRDGVGFPTLTHAAQKVNDLIRRSGERVYTASWQTHEPAVVSGPNASRVEIRYQVHTYVARPARKAGDLYTPHNTVRALMEKLHRPAEARDSLRNPVIEVVVALTPRNPHDILDIFAIARALDYSKPLGQMGSCTGGPCGTVQVPTTDVFAQEMVQHPDLKEGFRRLMTRPLFTRYDRHDGAGPYQRFVEYLLLGGSTPDGLRRREPEAIGELWAQQSLIDVLVIDVDECGESDALLLRRASTTDGRRAGSLSSACA